MGDTCRCLSVGQLSPMVVQCSVVLRVRVGFGVRFKQIMSKPMSMHGIWICTVNSIRFKHNIKALETVFTANFILIISVTFHHII